MAKAVAQLAKAPVSYGKAAIVGVAGDLEYGGAMIHPKLGKPMRAAVGGGKALIPSNAKVAPAGTPSTCRSAIRTRPGRSTISTR